MTAAESRMSMFYRLRLPRNWAAAGLLAGLWWADPRGALAQQVQPGPAVVVPSSAGDAAASAGTFFLTPPADGAQATGPAPVGPAATIPPGSSPPVEILALPPAPVTGSAPGSVSGPPSSPATLPALGSPASTTPAASGTP